MSHLSSRVMNMKFMQNSSHPKKEEEPVIKVKDSSQWTSTNYSALRARTRQQIESVGFGGINSFDSEDQEEPHQQLGSVQLKRTWGTQDVEKKGPQHDKTETSKETPISPDTDLTQNGFKKRPGKSGPPKTKNQRNLTESNQEQASRIVEGPKTNDISETAPQSQALDPPNVTALSAAQRFLEDILNKPTDNALQPTEGKSHKRKLSDADSKPYSKPKPKAKSAKRKAKNQNKKVKK